MLQPVVLVVSVILMMRKLDGKILYAQGEEDFADFPFQFFDFTSGSSSTFVGRPFLCGEH